MTQHGLAKKVKLARGDIFISKDGTTMVRINFISKKHKSIQDCLGDPTCHVFERGKDDLWHLKTGKKHLPIPFRERDYRYVRPSSAQVLFFLSYHLLLFLPPSFLPSYLLVFSLFTCIGNGWKAVFPKRVDS